MCCYLLELGDCIYSDISSLMRRSVCTLCKLVLLQIYISAINLLCRPSRIFVHRLYVRLLNCKNHVFQGLDTLTPTLILGNGLKMISRVLVMFSV